MCIVFFLVIKKLEIPYSSAEIITIVKETQI